MILCCGEALIDFVPLPGVRAYGPYPGGSVFNIAVGLGNAPTTPAVITALQARQAHPSELVREHVEWALRQHAAPL